MHLILMKRSLKLHSGKKTKSSFSSSKVKFKRGKKKSPDTTLVINTKYPACRHQSKNGEIYFQAIDDEAGFSES